MIAPAGDRLLWAITASGGVSWRSFSRLFDQLVAVEPGSAEAEIPQRRRETYGLLDALGHCEVLERSGTRELVPGIPCLSRLPVSGLPRAMLSGARQPQAAQQLQVAAARLGGVVTVNSSEHQLGLLPDRIELEAELPETLAGIAHDLHVSWQATPTAWILCSQTASLDEVLNTLQWADVQELNWTRKYFDPIARRMRDEVVDGDYVLVRYEHPYSRRLRFELRRGDVAATVDGAWGRYAVLRAARRQVITYDERRYLFAVPWGVPMPRLLRRALTCCTGCPPDALTPRTCENRGLSIAGADVYSGVVPAVASQASTKLGQRLTHADLSKIGD